MIDTTYVAPPASRPSRGAGRRFVLHYLEMVVTMIVGVVALGPVESFVLDTLGGPTRSTARTWPPW